MSIDDLTVEVAITAEEYDPHEVCWIVCEECGYRHVSVHPLGVPRLECPQCGFMCENPSAQAMIDNDE